MRTPDRREHPRTSGRFKDAEDTAYKILRKQEVENEVPNREEGK
jgi:hypothetical protein